MTIVTKQGADKLPQLLRQAAPSQWPQSYKFDAAGRPIKISSLRFSCKAAVMGVALVAAGTSAMAVLPGPFKQTNIHFETNASACDMGIQISFDTNGITRGEVENPYEIGRAHV